MIEASPIADNVIRLRLGPDHRRTIDIEQLLQMSFSQVGQHPFRNANERTLMFDHGFSAIPKGASKLYNGTEIALHRAVDQDAQLVLEAVARLPADIRKVVTACATSGIRPDWMPGIMPVLIERRISWRKARKKRSRRGRKVTGRSHVEKVWEPVSPETLRAIREIYSRWHIALLDLGDILENKIKRYQISSLYPPSAPWLRATQNNILESAQI